MMMDAELKKKIRDDLYIIMKKSSVELQHALVEGHPGTIAFWQTNVDADIERFLKVEFGG